MYVKNGRNVPPTHPIPIATQPPTYLSPVSDAKTCTTRTAACKWSGQWYSSSSATTVWSFRTHQDVPSIHSQTAIRFALSRVPFITLGGRRLESDSSHMQTPLSFSRVIEPKLLRTPSLRCSRKHANLVLKFTRHFSLKIKITRT